MNQSRYCQKYFKQPYGALPMVSPPPSSRSNGIVFPSYGEDDKYMLRYNELQKYTQHMNIQARGYDYLLASGMGPY